MRHSPHTLNNEWAQNRAAAILLAPPAPQFSLHFPAVQERKPTNHRAHPPSLLLRMDFGEEEENRNRLALESHIRYPTEKMRGCWF